MTTNNLISKRESEIPENNEKNPDAVVFKVKKTDLEAHLKVVRSFPFNVTVKPPVIKPFVNKEKLNAAKDEYIYIDRDPKGETKITENGYLLGNREFIASTFTLPGHGKKLFVLATEAAKITGFRDAFIMFAKHKDLLKYQASEEFKPFFTEHGLQVSKVKSRPISVITARSFFMFFGARVIQSGKRVIDDYWENQVVEQGFTEQDQVFPVDKKQVKPKAKPNPTKQRKTQAALYVTPLPSLEDRIEYLKAQSSGLASQVLPGQGISGGLELSSIASIPKYSSDPSSVVKHKSILSSLSTNSTSSVPVITQSSINQLAISNESAGQRSSSGLPIYRKNISKRLREEDPEKLKEIEYLHGAVETNSIISSTRKPRNRTWQYYWQIKSGTPFGLLRENEEEFKKMNEEVLKVVKEERIFNDYKNCDQIITKRRNPNPNFLNHGNITGLKPPYAEKPLQAVIPNPQTL